MRRLRWVVGIAGVLGIIAAALGLNGVARGMLDDPFSRSHSDAENPHQLVFNAESALLGDPTIAGSGEVRHQETDLVVASRGFPFRFTRVYRSQLLYDGPLGYGWDFNYNSRILLQYASGNVSSVVSVLLYDGTGRIASFVQSTIAGQWHPSDPGMTEVLDGVGWGSTTILRKTADAAEYEYGYYDAKIPNYRTYRLEAIRDKFGNAMQFSYETDPPYRLVGITDTEGRSCTVAYGADSRIASLTDSWNRIIEYRYDDAGNLTSVKERTGVDRETRYTYVEISRGTKYYLETAKAPREVGNSGDPYLINEYDPSTGRIAKQHNGAGYYEFVYYEGQGGGVTSLVYTDRNGCRTDLEFNSDGTVHKVIRHEDQQTFETEYDYTDTRLTRILYPDDPDPNIGRRIEERDYDSQNDDPRKRGNLTALRRIPATSSHGETTLTWTYTNYHATWNIPLNESDPNGRLVTRTVTEGNQGDWTITETVEKNGGQLEATTTTVLDGYGRPIQIINPEDERTHFSYYSTSGRVYQVSQSKGEPPVELLRSSPVVLLTMTYDTYGNVLLRTDSRGKTTSFTHDARHNLTDVYYPGGENYHATFSYDENDHVVGRVVPVRSGVTRQETLERDIHGNVTATEVERAASDTVKSETHYDPGERVAWVVDPEGRVTSLEWTARNLLKAVHFAPTTSLAATIRYEYDHEGRRTKTIDPLDHEWVVEYDGHGRVLRSTDPSGTWQQYGYQGTLTTLATTYRKIGNDPYIFRQTKTAYDELFRVQQVEALAKTGPYPEGQSGTNLEGGDGYLTTSYLYDRAGRVLTITDELGRYTSLRYDDYGRLAESAHQTGNKTAYTYVAYTNLVDVLTLTEKTAGNDKVTTREFTYDDLGRPVTYEDPAQQTTTTAYDFAGNILSRLDPEGNRVEHTRNYLGWVTQTVVKQGATPIQDVAFAYDASGLLRLATDAASKQTSLSYDARGRLVQRRYVPESTSHTWTYDAASHVQTLTDPRGTVFTYYYDDDRGLLTSVAIQPGQGVYGDAGPIRYSYDEVGMLTKAEDADSRIDRTHNTLGQVQTEKQYLSSQAMQPLVNYYRTVVSHFDGGARRYQVDYPYVSTLTTGTFVLGYQYDTLDRLTTLTRTFNSAMDTLASYRYEGYNRLAEADYANGTGLRVSYDVRNLVTAVEHQRLSDSRVLFGVDRVLDNAGRPTWRRVRHIDPAGGGSPYYEDVARYYYDGASRVSAAYHGVTDPSWPPQASDDPNQWASRDVYTLTTVDTRDTVERTVGQQSTMDSYSYDNGHEYTDAVIAGIAHVFGKDAAGNRTAHERTFQGLRDRSTQVVEYRYDAFNRLVAAIDYGKMISWRYDAFGRMIEEKREIGNDPTEIVRYYQDGDSAVLEVSVSDEQVPSSETILRRYVFGPEGPAPLFARKETGSVEAFFHADEQGSVLGLTDYTGQPVTVLEHYRYQRDFGEVTLHAGVSGTPASQIFPNLFGQPYLWKGGKLDRWLYDQCNGGENLGPWLLYHMGDRAYDPWTAAYLQRANVGPIAGRAFENPASVMDNPAEGAAGIRNPTGWPGAFGVAAIGSGPPTAPPCPVQRPLGAGDEEDPEEDEEEDPDRAEKDQGGGIIPPPENDIYNTDIDLEIYPEDVDPDILVDDNAPSRGLDPHQKAKVQETIDFIKALIAADPSLASKFGSIVKALEDALKNDIFEVCNLPGDKLAAVAGGQGRSGIEPGERIQLDPNWFQTDVVTRASLLVHESVHLLRAWSSHGNPAVAEKIDERNALFLEQSFVDAVARNAESLDSALKPKHNFGWLAASRNGRLESEWNKIFPPIRPDRTDRNYRIPPAFCQ